MSHYNWKFIWIVTLIIILGRAGVSASEKRPFPGGGKLPTGPGMGEIITKWVDVAHAEISKRILKTAQRFDAFFGDERIEEEKQNTQIDVTTSVKLTKEQKPVYTFPIGTNLALPRLRNRLHVMVDTLLKESKETEDIDKDETDDTDVIVNMRYKALEKAREWISLDGGVKVHPDTIALNSIEPFVKYRIRGTSDFDPWALRLTQFVFWFKNEGFSMTFRLDLERRIRGNILFRVTSQAMWSENNEEVQLTQSLFLRRQLSQNRAIGLELSGEGHTKPPVVADKYRAKITYRRRLYKNWAFFAIEPEVQFLKKNHFRRELSITFNFELTFGKFSK